MGRPPGHTSHLSKHDHVMQPHGTPVTSSSQGARATLHEPHGNRSFNQVTRIVIVYNIRTSDGALYAIGSGGAIVLRAGVVVGGEGHTTPTGKFHASGWGKDHKSTKYGSYADAPWSKSPLGLNAFGPYQLHIREQEKQGIYIHGTMGPGWNPFTTLNSLISPTSHGCVRMANSDDIRLHDLLPAPDGVEIMISTNPDDAPKEKP